MEGPILDKAEAMEGRRTELLPRQSTYLALAVESVDLSSMTLGHLSPALWRNDLLLKQGR